jgi:tRNA/rRNA methyltransferase/tRNA (cytidine32/uridine32-2'-O)-methyltransferase
MAESRLDRIRVVLFETQDLVNVAAVVRAMKNMGTSDLRLVNAVPLDAWRIQGIAHDTGDVLEKAREHATLDEAIADCVLVAAFTARHRAARWAVSTPREVTDRLLDAAADGPVALLFGREDRGLPNEALDRAHVHVTIPTTRYASLNLAQAVMVALYELHLAAGDATRARKPPRKDAPPPEAVELERFHADAEAALRAIDFFKTRYPEHVLRAVRSLVARADPNARELSLMRAMAIEVVKYLERVRQRAVPDETQREASSQGEPADEHST